MTIMSLLVRSLYQLTKEVSSVNIRNDFFNDEFHVNFSLFFSCCRWNHGRFRDLYNISDGVREDTAPARRAVRGTEAVHGPGQLCVCDGQGLRSEGSIQGTQRPSIRLYS